MDEVLATSIGRTKPHSVTFEVSDIFLDRATENAEWSEPVRFRFEKHDYDEGWDLVMRQVNPQDVEEETA